MVKVVKVNVYYSGDINLAETHKNIQNYQTMDILVHETILRQSVDFMRLFSLPNEIAILLNIIKIAYNSCFLPFHETEEEIMNSL